MKLVEKYSQFNIYNLELKKKKKAKKRREKHLFVKNNYNLKFMKKQNVNKLFLLNYRTDFC